MQGGHTDRGRPECVRAKSATADRGIRKHGECFCDCDTLEQSLWRTRRIDRRRFWGAGRVVKQSLWGTSCGHRKRLWPGIGAGTKAQPLWCPGIRSAGPAGGVFGLWATISIGEHVGFRAPRANSRCLWPDECSGCQAESIWHASIRPAGGGLGLWADFRASSRAGPGVRTAISARRGRVSVWTTLPAHQRIWATIATRQRVRASFGTGAEAQSVRCASWTEPLCRCSPAAAAFRKPLWTTCFGAPNLESFWAIGHQCPRKPLRTASDGESLWRPSSCSGVRQPIRPAAARTAAKQPLWSSRCPGPRSKQPIRPAGNILPVRRPGRPALPASRKPLRPARLPARSNLGLWRRRRRRLRRRQHRNTSSHRPTQRSRRPRRPTPRTLPAQRLATAPRPEHVQRQGPRRPAAHVEGPAG